MRCRSLPLLRRAAARCPVLLAAALLLASCETVGIAPFGDPPAGTGLPAPSPTAAAPISTLAGASIIASAPAAPALRPARIVTVPGTGRLVGPAAARTAAAAPAGDGGDITLNFVNADIREVVRELLGEQLHLNYVIDPKVQGTITAQTATPIPRDQVLPTLERVLRASGVALLRSGDVYRVAVVEDAAKAAAGSAPAPGQPGYGVRVVPLKYAGAAELKGILEPFIPPGATVEADGARNALILAGSAPDLDGLKDLIGQFDVDWLSGKSYAIYPLHVGQAKDVLPEVQAVLNDGATGGPLGGAVRLVPLERLNSILVISTQPAYLLQAKAWIERLDYGNDETTPQLFEYFVQNSRAADLARVLTQLFSSGQVHTVGAPTAPGTTIAQVTGSASPFNPLAPSTPAAPAATPNGPSPSLGGATNSFGTSGGLTGNQLLDKGGTQRADAADILGDSGREANANLPLPSLRIVADEKNNALVIYARPRDYRMVAAVIKKLDIVPLQVLIQATIAEVTLNDQLQYGLQYFLKAGSSHFEHTTSTSGLLTAADIAGVFPGFNYVLSTSSQNVVLNLLRSVSNVTVLSSPQLLVLDHQKAALQVGDQVPIVTQSAQSVITAQAPIVNSVDYRNTGVVLQVSPRVNSSGLITLEIDQEVSDVSNTTTSSIDSPTINDRHIASTVIVKDGETIALGGLIKNETNDTKGGVPVLSDIPVVGPLFRSTARTRERTELIVLLSPKVIRNPSDARAMTDELRGGMRALKPFAPTAR